MIFVLGAGLKSQENDKSRDDMKSTHNEAGLSPGKKSDGAPVHKQVRPDGAFDELAAKYGG